MRIGWVALAASLGVVLVPSHARACRYDSGPETIVPSGAMHPSNSAVVLIGWLLQPDELVATIDGEPVTLVIDDVLANVHYDSGTLQQYHVMPLRLEPAPEPGQEVSITGNPCGVTNCPAVDIAYVASEPDLEILGAAPELTFDIARYSAATGNDCAGTWSSLLRVHAEVDELAFAGEALVVYEVTARNEAAGLEATDRNVLAWLEYGPMLPFTEAGDEFPLDGWCVEIHMTDAAGNIGVVGSSCEACGLYEGEPLSSLDETPFEPVPGGPCDLGGSTSGEGSSTGEAPGTDTGASSSGGVDDAGVPTASSSDGGDDTSGDTPGADDVEGRGCGCAAGSRGDAMGGLALAGLALARSRRRRRSHGE